MKRTFAAAAAAATALIAGAAAAQDDRPGATANLQNADGTEIGTVEFTETASGLTHIVVEAEEIPEGVHGIHVHETGECDPSDGFESAGGHLAGDMEHGVEVEGGPHPGDLPNAHVQSDGVMAVEIFTERLPLDDSLFDDDGAAFVVHSGADDYESQPSGESGDRIACGVIARTEGA